MSGRSRALLGLGLLLGVQISCFQPPSDRVTFACDPKDEPSCPDGYTCEADGCCHRDGSDVEADFGACALGVESTGTDGTESTTG